MPHFIVFPKIGLTLHVKVVHNHRAPVLFVTVIISDHLELFWSKIVVNPRWHVP